MAYTTPLAYLTFGGPLYDGTEEWSTGLRLAGAGAEAAGDEAGDQVLCNAYAAKILTNWQAGYMANTNAKLSWVKFNRTGLDGKYRFNYTLRKDYLPAVAASNTNTPLLPPQVSLVATLRSSSKRGLAHAGRIYLPAPPVTLDSDGRITTASRDSVLGRVKLLLDDINSVDAGLYLAIASKVRDGATKRVVRVEVGRVLDTMRSRRTSLVEDYTGTDLAAG
jgi:hypothetical protein